ncbi:unnamed protein product [Owenia fusiformis]|uniref:C2H2-type domain-containing protein n=1 Tax=Owenia fusiformis TaxID=6347 RepID=A0A8S4N8X7_OWEFU|nr:unnamed protein product [Owenia fusiformis]
MGSTTDTSLTNMIQDAILKLCTHNITFTKSLEIDGIICVSPGEAQPDIVVKMHRTILKPQTKPDPPVKSWDETYNTNPNPHPFTTGYTLPQVSYPQGDQRMSYATAIPDKSRTYVRNTNTGSPRNRRTHITHTAATHEQPEVEFATHDPTQENLSTPGETIPVATQMTPVGLAETSAQGPEDSQCSRSEQEEQQTSLTSKNPDNKRKVESETFSNDDPPDKQAKIEIKEEPITIEVNDEDDDINDGDMNTGDWMQDNTLDSLDNTAEQNGNTQQQMQGTDPNSGQGPYIKVILCSDCGKQYKTKTALLTHMASIHKQGKHPCKYQGCDMVYSTKWKVDQHSRRHIGVKQFHCNKCGRKASSKQILKRHLCTMQNKDVLPKFACHYDDCSSKFKRKSELTYHVNVVHLDIRITCKNCGQHFKWRTNLQKHKKSGCGK